MDEVNKLLEEYAAAAKAGEAKKMESLRAKFQNAFKKAGDKLKSVGVKPFGGAFDLFSEAGQVYDAERESIKKTGLLLEELSGEGGLFAKISEFGEKGVGVFGRIDEGVKGSQQLAQNMKGLFAVFEESGATLSYTATVLNELGVSFGTLGDVLDGAVLGFKMTGAEADVLVRSIAGIGEATGVGMQTAMENFSAAQKSMAYDSKTLMDNFKSLQLTAAQTGVSFNKLTSAFGESMDEFGGSARKAGNLNAILGRSVFNSIDLLGKTEAERVSTIVKGIKESVDVQALGRNKFQLKAVAEGLGLTVDETRRLLTGQMSVDEALAGKQSTDPRVRAYAQQADLVLKRVNPALAQFEYTIRRTRSAMENVSASANKVQRDLIQTIGQNLIKGVPGLEKVLPSTRPADVMKSLDNLLNQLSVQDVAKIAQETGTGLNVADIKAGKVFDLEFLKREGGAAFTRFFTAASDMAQRRGGAPEGVVGDAEAERFGRMELPASIRANLIETVTPDNIKSAFDELIKGVQQLTDFIKKNGLMSMIK